MDERIVLFLHIAGAACAFGVLGAVFGGLAGAWFTASGGAAGGVFGPPLLNVWQRVLGRELSPRTRGIAGGAVEGLAFLTLVGGAIGGWVHQSGLGLNWLLIIGIGALLLALAAVLLGVLGYFLVSLGVKASGPIILGAMIGAFVGACWGGEWILQGAGSLGVRLSGSDPMFIGLLAGALLGGVLGCWIGLAHSEPEPPTEEKQEPEIETD